MAFESPKLSLVFPICMMMLGTATLFIGCGSSGSSNLAPAPIGDASVREGGNAGDGGTVDVDANMECLECGLLHAYTFPAGVALPDEVGTANAASVQVSEAGVAGRTAWRFSAATKDVVQLPPGLLGGFPKLSICTWFQLGSGSITPTLFSWRGMSDQGGLLQVGKDVLFFRATNSLSVAGFMTDTTTWHFVCGVSGERSLQGLELYFDGEKRGDDPSLPITNGPNNAVAIGANVSGPAISDYFEGSIDELYIWNRTLSAVEVRRLYGLGGARFW